MQENTRDWSAVEMSPRAREHYEKHFLARYKRYIKQVKETPLTLLIWGPGESGGDLYEKRIQIRGRLRERGFAAVFSEQVEKDYPSSGLSSKASELLQACSADLIIVLQCSFGAVAEVHDFAGYIRDIGHKLMIFINRDAVTGYSYKGALTELNLEFGNVHLFEYPKDVEECHLATKVIDRAEALRHAKWRRKHVR